MNLGFVDEANGDYNLTSSSDLIDAGTTTIAGLTLPTTDLNGNARIAGATIDIGPYEFSATKPTINFIAYTGTAQALQELTFTTDSTASTGRSINLVEYDYLNDGTFTTANTYTYQTAGTYTVNVKVTDSDGEFSTTTKTVTITELPFADMTDEQKLIKAIDPAYYSDIIALIDTEKSSSHDSGVTMGENSVTTDPNSYGLHTQAEFDTAISDANTSAYEAGKQYVQNNLSEFNLTTQTAMNTALADMNSTATASGIASGKAYVQTNPSEFNLTTITAMNTAIADANTTAVSDTMAKCSANPSSCGIDLSTTENITTEYINNLDTGWTLTGTAKNITDLTVFESAKTVWIYSNGSWSAYSSNQTTQQAIKDANINILTSISANSGIWVLK